MCIRPKKYKRAIESLAETKSDFIFPNSNAYHAAVVLTTIIRHAQKRIRIYDDALNGDISGDFDAYNELLPLLYQHVKQKKRLEIVVRDGADQASAIYKLAAALSEQYKDAVAVRVASPTFKDLVKASFERDMNFAVGDDDSFRLEEYVENARERKAICSFNQPTYASKLNGIFNKEFSNCEPVF